MEQILQEAKRLGKLLAGHPSARAYMEAKKRLNADASAQQLLKDYEAQARKIAELERQTKPVEVEDKRRLAELQSQISANDVLKDFMHAQVEYLDLLRRAHDAINEQLDSAAE